jgi:hypothetical protein
LSPTSIAVFGRLSERATAGLAVHFLTSSG